MKIKTKAEECNCDQALELKEKIEVLVDLCISTMDGYYWDAIEFELKRLGIEGYE